MDFNYRATLRNGNSTWETQLRQRAAQEKQILHACDFMETVEYMKMLKNIKDSKNKSRYYKNYHFMDPLEEDTEQHFESSSKLKIDVVYDSDDVPTFLESDPPRFERFLPQKGEEGFLDHFSTMLDDVAKYANLDISDEIVSELEGVVALILTIQGCTDFVSMSAAIFLYARKHFNKSAASQVMAYVNEMFQFETQDGPEDMLKTTDWIEMMRSIRSNWALVRKNKLFTHFSKLLGLIVTLGMCEASSVTLNVKDYKVWEPDMRVVHGDAMDVADAALQTVTYFVETISLCCEEKSLRPLIMDDEEAVKLDEEYANVILWWDLVKNGNLKRVAGVEDHDFDKRLEDLCTRLRALIGSKASFEKKIIEDKFMRLLQVKNDYITMKINSGVRKAPYAIELFGASSQGKTTVGDQVLDALLASVNQSISKDRRASYNAGDKFMSNWTSDKLVLVIDDMANEKSQFVERPPTRIIIDVCNNQPYYANMAELDRKGKNFMEPLLCLVNTNIIHLDAFIYSNCPYSIQRRMRVVITVAAKKKFQAIVDGRPQGIDSQKVEDYYAKTGIEPTFDDLWELSVTRAIQPKSLKLVAKYGPVYYRGKPLTNVSFRTVVQYLIEDFHAHIKAQEGILRRMKKRSKGIKLCGVDGCKQIMGYCDVHDHLNKAEIEKMEARDPADDDPPNKKDDPKEPSDDDPSEDEAQEEPCDEDIPEDDDGPETDFIYAQDIDEEHGLTEDELGFHITRPKRKDLEDIQVFKDRRVKEMEVFPELAKRMEGEKTKYKEGTIQDLMAYYELQKDQLNKILEEFENDRQSLVAEIALKKCAKQDKKVAEWKAKRDLDKEEHKRQDYLARERAKRCNKSPRLPIIKEEVEESVEDEDSLPPVFEPHIGEQLAWKASAFLFPVTNMFGAWSTNDVIDSAIDGVSTRVGQDVFGLEAAVEGAATVALMAASKRFVSQWDWMSVIPTPWLKSETFQNFLMLANAKRIKQRYALYSSALWGSLVGGNVLAHRRFDGRVSKTCKIASFLLGLTAQKFMIRVVKKHFTETLVDRNAIAPAMKELRDKHVGKVCKAVAIVGTIYALAKVYRGWRKMRAQGSLEPKTQEEIDKRDAEGNVWTEVAVRELPVQENAKNTSSSQLLNLVKKNLVYGTVVCDGTNFMVNGLFLKSNIVIIPNHYFKTDSLDITFRKENPEAAGGKFAVRISKCQTVHIPDTDLRICYSSSGGSFKDLVRYLPTERVGKHEFDLVWRTRTGPLVSATGVAIPKRTSNMAAQFNGHEYASLTINTFKGMCGAILVSKVKPLITGIHLGGLTGEPKGCCGELLAQTAKESIEKIRTFEGTIVSGSAEKFENQVLGVNIIKDAPLHRKSPLNFMPKDSQVEYYGSCSGMTTFKSNVKNTIISDIVTEVTGEKNIYMPPVESPQWYGWQTCLANLAVPALPYEPSLLQIAVVDYKAEMLDVFRSSLWNGQKPLTDCENMNGIPGLKFMDSIKLNTAIGPPLVGCKRKFLEDDTVGNRKFKEVITNEIQRCENCYARGERAYTLAKACKKDEVLSKKKCRIFYGNSIALTWLIRKYFLPILRVMQMNPLKSECAVGVNSHGPEWEELHKHIFHFGANRLIGGDYGKYDQKLPSQLIFAALRIMIDFARECNYAEKDLRIMEAMTGDIVYAIIAYNGDLIGLTEGTHISGNSLTVIINGICGSLNLRCYFYSEYLPKSIETRMKFREYVKLMTYGDDNIGSVDEAIDRFTIKGISEFLKEYGQVYTMPDKESELLDFLPEKDFEFLKRKSVYHPELNGHVGALVDKSCIKMLHCYLRDAKAPLTEEHACGLNIDTALREWFNHGRDIYEMRRKQMIEIAAKANITHLCAELEFTFDDRVLHWKDKYLDTSYVRFNEPDYFDI